MSGRRFSIRLRIGIPEWNDKTNGWVLPTPTVELSRKLRTGVTYDTSELSDDDLDRHAVKLAAEFKQEVVAEDWVTFFKHILVHVQEHDRTHKS